MVLLKFLSPDLKEPFKTNLHSTMVLLKFFASATLFDASAYLHSTMVLLKLKSSGLQIMTSAVSTFHYCYIKIMILS